MHNYSYLALGDSYTIGEGVEEKDSFPFQIKALLESKYNCTIDTTVIAKTGWTCEELYEAMNHHRFLKSYDFISVCIGVNNQYRGLSLNEYYKSIAKLYNRILKWVDHPSKIIVVSIPDYSTTPFVKEEKEKVRTQLNLFNTMNAYVMKESQYVDITEMSGELFLLPEGLTTDDLHPSKNVYSKWVEKIEPCLHSILN